MKTNRYCGGLVSRLSKPSVLCAQTSGFTLIEVLVSIVILSFGVLGVVGLQAAALKSNHEAKNQMTGVQLARELADIVRSNRAVGTLTENNPYVGSFAANAMGEIIPATASYCLSVGSSCDSANAVAQAQLTQWLAHVGSVLPTARVVTCFDDEPYNSNGLPQWRCPATPSPGAPLVIKMGWTRSTLDKSRTGAHALDRAESAESVPGIVLPFTP